MKPGKQITRKKLLWMRRILQRRSISTAGVAMIVLCGFLGFAQVVPNGPLIAVIVAVVGYEFQKWLDQGVPLLQLTGLLAVLQWLVGPVLNYASDYQFGRYSMYVSEEKYFGFALPATALYVAVMLVVGASVKQGNLLQLVDRRNFFSIGIILNVVAIASSLAAARVGGSLQFVCHLVTQTRYMGALYFLFSRHQLRVPAAAASCIVLVTGSAASGMFHDMILWLAFLFCYWFAQHRWVLSTKLVVLSVVAFALFSIQVVKQDYRRQLALGDQPSLISMAWSYVTPGGDAWEDDSLSLAITRLNQGWIISAVMQNVPENEPFAEGETIKEALLSALAPRLLWAEKKTAGGRESFRRFTGLQIGDATSMGISPLGEAYANFGVLGGAVFMVLLGTAFAAAYYCVLLYSFRRPTFFFWFPLIFYQAVKAETELVVVLNQLTKGAVVAVGMHYGIHRMFPARTRLPAQRTVFVQPSASQSYEFSSAAGSL